MSDIDPLAAWLIGAGLLFAVGMFASAAIQAAEHPYEAAVVLLALVVGVVAPYAAGRLFLGWLY